MMIVPGVNTPGMLPDEPSDLYDVGDISDAAGEPVAGEPSSISEVAAALRTEIYSGTYRAGARFRTREAIAEEHGVSPESAGVALRMLRSEGLVTLEQGRGTFVCKLTAYRVTVTVHWMISRDTAVRIAREIAGRNADAEAAGPAVTRITLDSAGADWAWTWTWRMTVRAARPGLAAVIGESVARSAAAGELGDFARAAVHAEPAGEHEEHASTEGKPQP